MFFHLSPLTSVVLSQDRKHSFGDGTVSLHDDVTPIQKDWLPRVVEHACQIVEMRALLDLHQVIDQRRPCSQMGQRLGFQDLRLLTGQRLVTRVQDRLPEKTVVKGVLPG